MTWTNFWTICLITALCNALCRVMPMFALSQRPLSRRVTTALEYIPAAAFAALVMSDLFNPAAFVGGLWPALLPFCAAVPVMVVSHKTHSLGLSVVVGLAAYAALMWWTV